MERLWTAVFESCHRCSVWFRPSTWIFFDINHYIVCWKVNLHLLCSLQQVFCHMFSSIQLDYLIRWLLKATDITGFCLGVSEHRGLNTQHNFQIFICLNYLRDPENEALRNEEKKQTNEEARGCSDEGHAVGEEEGDDLLWATLQRAAERRRNNRPTDWPPPPAPWAMCDGVCHGPESLGLGRCCCSGSLYGFGPDFIWVHWFPAWVSLLFPCFILIVSSLILICDFASFDLD